MIFPGRSQSRLFSLLLTAAVVLPVGTALAQGLPGSRYLISQADIAKGLGVVGVNVDASQIHIPAGMSATSTSPNLEIVTAEPMGNNQVRLELRCSTVAECLPFFATLDVKESTLVSTEIRSRPGAPVAADHRHAGADPASQPQIRVGSQATLIIQDRHLDIHLQVLAIDTGVLGQQVRVSTLDRKKVFRATVTGEGTVTGAIE